MINHCTASGLLKSFLAQSQPFIFAGANHVIAQARSTMPCIGLVTLCTDYTSSIGTVNFPDGELEACIEVPGENLLQIGSDHVMKGDPSTATVVKGMVVNCCSRYRCSSINGPYSQ